MLPQSLQDSVGIPFFPNMAPVLSFFRALLSVSLLSKGLEEVSYNDGDGGASEQLQLSSPAGVSGGQRRWTVGTDRCLPHHRQVSYYL